MRTRTFLLAAVAITAVVLGTAAVADATSVPSGQRLHGRSIVEPAYDAGNAGVIGFLATPPNGSVTPGPHHTAPLYLPVYPTGSTVGALICPHVPVDTCPDHGPAIAGLAQATTPGVYGNGVLGHDHLMTFHGEPGFHVDLEPVVVLFTSKAAADEHLLTAAAVDAAVQRGDAITVPLPGASLHGEEVPRKVWTLATPIA